VESVKAASDVYAPLSGEVLEVNTELSARPEAVNKDPYGKGWLAVIKAADLGEKSNLMDAAKYREYAESLSK
jgi:glycine cleavage system H protein